METGPLTSGGRQDPSPVVCRCLAQPPSVSVGALQLSLPLPTISLHEVSEVLNCDYILLLQMPGADQNRDFNPFSLEPLRHMGEPGGLLQEEAETEHSPQPHSKESEWNKASAHRAVTMARLGSKPTSPS